MKKSKPFVLGRFRRHKRRDELSMVRRVTQDAHAINRLDIRSILWDAFIYLSLTCLLSIVAFLGRPPHAPIVQLHQRPKFTFEAPFDFTYQSENVLNARRDIARNSVIPVFRVDTDTLDTTLARYRDFIQALIASRPTLVAMQPHEREVAIRELLVANPIPGNPRNLALAASNAIELSKGANNLDSLLNASLTLFDDLSKRGIYDDKTFAKSGGDAAVSLIRGDAQRRELSVPEARRSLHNGIYYQAAADTGSGGAEQAEARRLAGAVASLFHEGLLANIHLDQAATSRAREAAAAAERPVPTVVREGTPLIERDVAVGVGSLERWRAFRHEFSRREAVDFGLTRTFVANTLWGVAIMALVVMYGRVVLGDGPRRKRFMTLVAIMAVTNLLLMRLFLWASETGVGSRVGEALHWASPFVLAPLVVAVVCGPHLAILSALLVSGFTATMYGNSLQMLFGGLLSALVAIRYVSGVRTRSRIVTAGVLSALPIAFMAFYDNVTPEDWKRAETYLIPGGALVTGLLTGIAAVGLVPYLEKLFKTTTDITLLEFTDYNHPLLRKLQMLAPGTFHHSVMVANLAERAADDIGANSLLCRCASLYHDIGKMPKPEYFVENQNHGQSPHADMSPSMSALVIKSHVREGVEIAREYRIPRVIVDVIEQHHGTGLIRYFYHKACKSVEDFSAGCSHEPGVLPPETDRAVDESLFRYDGPKPRTREAAIIFLADSVEAASRSLKKVTPQSVETLVDNIVGEAIKDGQLDECPLSFRDVLLLRKSFRRSLLTSLHQRVEYPGSIKPAGK